MTRAEETLLRNRLVRFGVSREEVDRLMSERRFRHQWGPGKRDVTYLSLEPLLRSDGFAHTHHGSWLRIAEHIARVVHNWRRCYTVDTTRLAMAARA